MGINKNPEIVRCLSIVQYLARAVCDCGLQKHSQAVLGALSALEADAGVICVLNIDQDMELGYCCLASSLLVMPLQGRCDITLAAGSKPPMLPLASIPADEGFSHLGRFAAL